MTFQTYSLTRVIDGGHAEFAQSFTTSDDDAINCAHMLAAGFNTMSRNMLNGWVLAVVDTEDGRVFYDDKAEHIRRNAPSKPGVYEQTFKFEPSVDADTIVSLLSGGGGNGMFNAFGKVDVQSAGPYEAPSKYAHVARSVLEDAYAEMQAVKSIVEEVGVETIPLSSGVREMQYMIERRDEEIAAFHQERLNHAAERTAARAELIEYVKREREIWKKLDRIAPANDEHMHAWERGMIDVLAKFLVVTGEADAEEGHATARRLCGINDG